MRYTATVRREDGTEYESAIDTTAGNKQAAELARNLAESYGHELVALKSADGEEIDVGDNDRQGSPAAEDKQENDDQNKTATERVDDQRVETKEVAPDKTGDVRPNR